MRIQCFKCHKPISTEITDEDFVLRGTATCPECEEKSTDVKGILEYVDKTKVIEDKLCHVTNLLYEAKETVKRLRRDNAGVISK